MKDPPRQDYTIYASLAHYTFPPFQPEPEISAARASALNDLLQAYLDLAADLQAAALSSDRYQGAAAAGNPTWAAQQMAALLYYKKLSGAQMLLAAGKIDALLAEIHTEGIQDMILSAATVRASQNEWATTGLPGDEILVDQSIGMSTAEIEAMRQNYIAADANLLAGSVLDHLANLAAAWRALGSIYMNPPNFQIPGALAALGVQPRSPSALKPNQLGRFYQSTTTFQLGNPLTAFATITLSLRPLDLPPDWSVTITPSSASLNPGQQTTITVTISEGSAVPQGIQPRLAVEGYANGQLLGGVVIDVLVPNQGFFDGKLRVYLPVITH